MSSTESASLDDWKNSVKSQQKGLSIILGDRVWDAFKYPSNKVELCQKIGIALYGKALAEADDLGFPKEKQVLIHEILDKCLKHSLCKEEPCLAVIYIAVYVNEGIQYWVPLIRVRSKNCVDFIEENIYIDHLGRVYDNFDSYLKENTWELCYIGYPKNGYYVFDQNFEVSFLEYSSTKVLHIADTACTITNIVTTCTMLGGVLMTLFPLTAPIGLATVTISAAAGAPGLVYGVGRSIGKLVDRGIHEQSISLMDPEARQHWLLTVTSLASTVALTSTAIISHLAKSGVAVSNTAKGVCTGLQVVSVSCSGSCLVNQTVNMFSRGETPTSLEIFQLTTSVLFFTHSIIGFKTAQAIYEENQISVISKMKNYMQENFDNTLKIIDKNLPEIKPEFIRKIARIDHNSLNQFKGCLQSISKEVSCGINKIFPFETTLFLSESEIKIILNSFQQGKITSAVNNLMQKLRLSISDCANSVFENNLMNCKKIFNKYISIRENLLDSDNSSNKKQNFLKLNEEFKESVTILVEHCVNSLLERKNNNKEVKEYLSDSSINEYIDFLVLLSLLASENNIYLPIECLTVIMDKISRESFHLIQWHSGSSGDYRSVKCTLLPEVQSFQNNPSLIDFIICDEFFITSIYYNGELKEGPWLTLLKHF